MTTRHKHADVIIAWAEGAKIEYRKSPEYIWNSAESPGWYENYEYRVKPPAKKYRVGLFKFPGSQASASVVNSAEEAQRCENTRHFVRWLTDWIEHEE